MIDQLINKIKKTEAPIVVGLDPTMKFVPEHIKKQAFAEYGETGKGAAQAVWLYNKAIIDAVCDLIPAVKPQIAMYEQFGVEGLIAFQKTVEYCKEKGLVVIGDIKRGDIGSTSEAYAVGHLGKVQVGSTWCRGFDEDFVTVNPYLGSDGVKPFIKVCQEEKKGIFVLVKTSNPSSGEFQDRLVRCGTKEEEGTDRPLYEIVGEQVAAWGSEIPIVMWALWLAQPIRNREGSCARLCLRLIFWCPDTALREVRAQTWCISSIRMVWVRSLTLPEES